MKQVENLIITNQKPGENLSKSQITFNNLVKKIDKAQNEIIEAKRQIVLAEQRVAKEIVPAQSTYLELIVERLEKMDSFYDEKQLTKSQRKKLKEVLLSEITDLLSSGAFSDAQYEKITSIYNKHNIRSYEQEMEIQAENERAIMKDVMSKMFGMDIEEDDLKNPDAFEQKLEQEQQKRIEEQRERQKTRKKTKAQIQKEEKIKQEEKNIGQTSRKIYMELVKAFHPDTEPDEKERIRKTEVMKKVTNAYQKNDLFELLKLQLEFLQISKESIASLADDKLQYYNKILKSQLESLQDELIEVKGGFNPFQESFYKRYCGSQKQMNFKFQRIKKSLETSIESVESALSMFKEGVEGLLVYLSYYKRTNKYW